MDENEEPNGPSLGEGWCPDIGLDVPVPIKKAGEVFFRGALTASAFRREHQKGNLQLLRIAGKDFVTKRDLLEMLRLCSNLRGSR